MSAGTVITSPDHDCWQKNAMLNSARAQLNRDQRHQHHHRHERRAQAERNFARSIERQAAAQKTAGEIAAQKAADSRGRVRNPCVVADLLDIEVARVVEIFGQPEEQESTMPSRS